MDDDRKHSESGDEPTESPEVEKVSYVENRGELFE
jgi:hypothetical protein